ncbi:MAG: ABC transporter substrate-binding protein [bacterium]|nr:ABC transporter substrate-binding protein [bacterium]
MIPLRNLFSGFVLAFGLLLSWTAAAQTPPELLIGVLDEPNGSITRGVQLALNVLNDAGGVEGADGVVYRLNAVIVPTNFGSQLEPAIESLQNLDVIAVIGPARSEDVSGNLEALQALGVPVFTPAQDDLLIVSDSSEGLFRIRAADLVIGQALAAHIINEFGLREIITVQLDNAGTAQALGFRQAAENLGAPSGSAVLRDPEQIDLLAEQLIQTGTDVFVTFGNPSLAGVLYRDLRATGWEGLFVYNQADDPNFRGLVPADQLEGILSATTWAFTSVDQASVAFLNAYIRTFGALPDAVAAASYDAVQVIAAAAGQPGSLRDTILSLDEVQGIQGRLTPGGISDRELSSSVTITRLGLYGAPEVLARYNGGILLPPDVPGDLPQPTLISPLTPTPEGVFISIRGARQNVRSGPSISFPVLGQLNEGETAPVIGALPDNTWVVIDYRGQQGWLATYLLDVTGDLAAVPIITPPPTATPLPATATPTPSPEPDLVIDSVTALPSPIVPGQQFTLAVAVRNAGFSTSGAFSVAATLPPNNILVTTVVPPLAPGQAFVANMTGTLSNTGTYATTVIVDAQSQIPEGFNGETNNAFAFSYTVDRTLRRQGGQTLNLGDTIDLEGDAVQGDANWNADGELAVDAINGAKLGILPGTDLNAIHWDLINPLTINRDSIPRTELNVGTLIGIITADGSRGVLRVDAITDTQITVAFKVYNL